MKEPVRILSDLHLGHKVSRIEKVSALRPLIAGAGTVVFNGDTWQELTPQFREHSATLLDELQALCAEEGAETVFLAGNHDPGWPGPGWLELAGGRIIITHGDALLYAGSPWKREIIQAGQRVAELWDLYPAAKCDAQERLRLARAIACELCSTEAASGRTFIERAWDAAVPPIRALRMLESWFYQAAAGASFCDRYFPKAEALVIGHFHWQGSWVHDHRLTINTGSFMAPCRAHWVEWRNGWLSHGEIDESADLFGIGRTLGVWRFELQALCRNPAST